MCSHDRRRALLASQTDLLEPEDAVTTAFPLHSPGDPKDIHACKRKNRYQSEAHTREVGRNMLLMKWREGIPAPEKLYPYPCVNCRCWHLTKQVQPHTLPLTRVWLIEGVMS
jgi:hypothetical protein